MMDRIAVSTFIFTLFFVDPAAASAEQPRVYFDMPYAVACRDVTSSEFALANPGEKLVEVKFQVSSLLQSGSESDLAQYFYRIDSPQRTFAVVDYLPKTQHESPLSGNVGIKNTDEQSVSIGINFSGHYENITGIGASSGLGQKNISCVEYAKLPPLETVTASGTILRGTGVYFKLKSTERNLLEGERSFALILRVPRTWRADYVHLRCEAAGVKRGVVRSLDESVACGERDFLVGLYLEGDAQARAAAEQFAASEAQLRSVVRIKGSQITERAYPTLAQKFGAALALNGPAIPENWLPRVLYGSPASLDIPKRLPREVYQAAGEYSAARQRLRMLAGNVASDVPPTAAVAGP